MKIINAVRILLLVFLVLALFWGLGVSYWTLSGTSQQAVTTPSQRFPFPWSGAIDFIETPAGDVYVLSEVFNSILRYDQAGRVIARYRFLSEHSPIYTRLAVGHDGTIYVQTPAAVHVFSARMEKLAVIKPPRGQSFQFTWILSHEDKVKLIVNDEKKPRLDRAVRAGEILFGIQSQYRKGFLCHDGSFLMRTIDGLEKQSADGAVLLRYYDPWWMRPFIFPHNAFLAWPVCWLLFFLFLLVSVMRYRFHSEPDGIHSKMTTLVAETDKEKQQRFVLVDDASPHEKHLLIFHSWFPIGRHLFLFVMMAMPAMFILLFYMATRPEYLGTVDGLTRFLIFMNLASPLLFLIFRLEWFAFRVLAGSTHVTIDLSSRRVTLLKGIILPFPVFVEANIKKASVQVNDTHLELREPVEKWGITFHESTLYLILGKKRIVLARDYSRHAHQKMATFLGKFLPPPQKVEKPFGIFQLITSAKTILILIMVVCLGVGLSPILLPQPAPVRLHNHTITHDAPQIEHTPPRFVLPNFHGGASFLAFSRDGATLVTNTGYYSTTLKVWDASTGKLLRTIGKNTETISISTGIDSDSFFSESNPVVADMAYHLNLGLWNPAFGTKFSTPRVVAFSEPGKMHAFAYSTFADWFAAVEYEQEHIIRLWRFSDGQQLPSLQVPERDIEMNRLWFAPDGSLLIAEYKPLGSFLRGYKPPELAVFDTGAKTHLRTLTGHKRYRISALAFWPDGRTLASAGDDEQIILWDLEQPQNSVTCKGHKYSINGLASSPDGRWLVSVSGESSRGGATSGEVKIWDIRQRQGVDAFQLPYPAESVAFSPDGQLLAISYGYYRKEIGNIGVWSFSDIIRETTNPTQKEKGEL